MRDTITFKGDKKVWFDFTNEIRKKGQTVWEVLCPMLQGYMLREETLRTEKGFFRHDVSKPKATKYKKQGEI